VTATIPSPATVPHKPWRSGFCNPSHDVDSHRRCAGDYDGRPCRCGCHVAARILELAEQIEQCADLVIATDLTGMDAVTAVQTNSVLNAARAKVANAQTHVARHIGDVWGGPWKKRLTVPGVGDVRPYQKKKTTWRDAELAEEIVRRRMGKLGGVVPDPVEVVDWIREAASINYWRVGVLDQLGITADDFRDDEGVGDVRLSVYHHRDKPEETDQ
jgi:hypothetical protein